MTVIRPNLEAHFYFAIYSERGSQPVFCQHWPRATLHVDDISGPNFWASVVRKLAIGDARLDKGREIRLPPSPRRGQVVS